MALKTTGCASTSYRSNQQTTLTLDLLRVSGTRVVRVNLFGDALVQRDESSQQILASSIIVVAPSVVREVVLKRGSR